MYAGWAQESITILRSLGEYSLPHKALHPDIMIYHGFSDEMWSQNVV